MDPKRIHFLGAVLIWITSSLPIPAPAQERLTVAPDPSYAEGGPPAYRHPEVDTKVHLYINHWRNSPPLEGHGGLIERDILTRGDPLHPARKGAVLKYIKAYRRGVLQPRTNTMPRKDAGEQVFFYVSSGRGIWLQVRGRSLLFFGNRLLRQEPGEAFLIPPNYKVPHSSINHTGEPMLWLYMGCRHEEDASASLLDKGKE